MNFIIRKAEESDLNLIYSSWLKSFYHGNTPKCHDSKCKECAPKEGERQHPLYNWIKEIPAQVYFPYYRKVIERLLLKESIDIRIACLEDALDVVLGYAILDQFEDQKVLHWVWVKSAFRKMGIMKGLLKDDPIHIVTHMTKVGKALKPKNILFNPFII